MDAELAPVTVSAVHGLDQGPDPSLHGVDLDDALAMPCAAPGNHDRWALLDPLIDAIAPIVPEHPVPGEAAWRPCRPPPRGSKPFAIEGFNDETQHWKPRHRASATRAFQAGCSWPTAWARSMKSSSPGS